MVSFPAPILRMDHTSMPYHYLPIPADIAEDLLASGNRRVIIHAGGTSIRRYMFRTANGQDAVIVGLAILRDMGLRPGDVAHVDLEVDPDPDRVDLCEEFEAALSQDDEANERFQSMTTGQQRSLAYHVGSAKRTETRIRRALDMCFKLRTNTLHGDRSP